MFRLSPRGWLKVVAVVFARLLNTPATLRNRGGWFGLEPPHKMKEAHPENFGFSLETPVPQDYGLTDSEVKLFNEKSGILSRLFNSEYSKIRHKKGAYKRYKHDLERYTLACYRGRIEFWNSLGHKQFEIEVAKLFQGIGWDVCLTGASGDRGIDIKLFKNDRLAVVQCKAYNMRVGPSAVRDLHSAMITAGAYKGYLVSARGFTKGAYEEKIGKRIDLIPSLYLAYAELSGIANNSDKHNGMGSALLWDDYEEQGVPKVATVAAQEGENLSQPSHRMA